MKYKTYTFRAYPNKTQAKLIDLTFIMCRLMFNTMLKIVFDNYSKYVYEKEKCLENGIIFDVNKFNNTHKIPPISRLKKVNDNYKKVDSLAICAEYSNLVRGMDMFYRGHSNKPKFKRNNDKLSYTTSQVNNNIRIERKKVRLPKVGFVKVRGMRYIPAYFTIKRAVVFKDKKGKYFISVIFEYDENHEKISKEDSPTTSNTVGLDFKINNIFVSSDNFIPKYSQNYFNFINNIPKLQKIINRKKKFSKNYWKCVDKLRASHRKIVNIRKNMLHYISSFLTKKYTYFIIEDISIIEVVLKLKNGKNTYNTAFSNFIKLLSYKSNEKVIKIDKWFPSSKTCCNCGNIKKELLLSDKTYFCNICKLEINRDLNAALNIKFEGLKLFGIN